MPRGIHNQKVKEEQILDQFENGSFDRRLLTARELAESLEETEGISVTKNAIHQRLHRMKGDTVEIQEDMAGPTYWKEKGDNVFSDGGIGSLSDLFGVFFRRERTSFTSDSDFVDITAGNLLILITAMLLNSIFYIMWLITGDTYIWGIANGISIFIFVSFVMYLYLVYGGRIAFLDYIGDLRKRG